MQERKLEKEVVKLAERYGWLTRKLEWVGRRSAPDRIFMRSGVVLFIELKQKDGRLSVGQKREIWRLLDSGVRVFVCRSLGEVELILKSETHEFTAAWQKIPAEVAKVGREIDLQKSRRNSGMGHGRGEDHHRSDRPARPTGRPEGGQGSNRRSAVRRRRNVA